jgi:hypothetical protein
MTYAIYVPQSVFLSTVQSVDRPDVLCPRASDSVTGFAEDLPLGKTDTCMSDQTRVGRCKLHWICRTQVVTAGAYCCKSVKPGFSAVLAALRSAGL